MKSQTYALQLNTLHRQHRGQTICLAGERPKVIVCVPRVRRGSWAADADFRKGLPLCGTTCLSASVWRTNRADDEA